MTVRTPRRRRPDLGRTLRALRSRNFRLFFAGQLVSLLGTWIQQVAMSWLVYRLTGSAMLLGTVAFASQLPGFFLTPFAGVLADRWNRHRMVLAMQALAMLQALTLAALTLTGRVEVWHIVALGSLLGVVNAFDVPARQSFLVQLVERREDLPNAIALNSSMFNGARLVGPAVAGVIIAVLGEGICFLLNGLSYLAVIGALLAMRIPQREPAGGAARVLGRLREGVRYALDIATIRSVLLLLAMVSLLGMSYTVLMPVFATEVLGGGPDTLGLLVAATGLGALAGALYLAARSTVVGLGKVIVFAVTLFGAGLIAFAVSRTLWLSVALLLVTGFGMMVQTASTNTILQTIVDEDKRGRIMSLYTLAFMGVAPFGSLLYGLLASWIGAPGTTALGGAGCIVGAVLFARRLPQLRAEIRPIYARLGIIPEVAQGIGTASQLMVPPEKQ